MGQLNEILKLQSSACLIFALCALIVPDIKALQNTKDHETIKIGLLIADNKSLAAKHGAEMAIRSANEKGGFNGLTFQLVVRSMEGPWGTGSKQAVNLIFDEEVWAIVGSHDGRNAHLVEQVATKARIVFLSAWARDPTLSQAFVPWYFSCVPNDNQQADVLIEEIYNRRNFIKVAAVSDNSYDSKLALKSFVKKTKAAGKTDPLLLFYENTAQDLSDLPDKINKTGAGCVILFTQPSSSMKLIRQIRSEKMNLPVYGSLALLDENQFSNKELMYYENVVFASSENWLSPKGLAFREEYQRRYGNIPGAVAAYAYDGMNLIIEAIRNAGLDREKIQKSLKRINFEGVTGPIQFDDKGNRIGNAGLIEIKNSIPLPVRR